MAERRGSRARRVVGLAVAGVAGAGALAVSAGGVASAASRCDSATVERQRSDFGPVAVQLAQFPPSLGTLSAVTLTRGIASDQVSRVESRDARAQGVALRSTVSVNLSSPSFAAKLPPLTTTSEATLQLAAFDGVVDDAGPSGRSGVAAAAPAVSSTATATDAATLAAFTGTGTVTFSAAADGHGVFLGPGNADYAIATYASATVEVCYTYRAAPPTTTGRPSTSPPLRLGRPPDAGRPPRAASPPTTGLATTGAPSHDATAGVAYVLLALGGMALLVGGVRRRS